MSNPPQESEGGEPHLQGRDLATVKSIYKKKKKNKHESKKTTDDAVELDGEPQESPPPSAAAAEGENIYTIDAAKKMKYKELFPVEAKKFGYDPSNKARIGAQSVEEALDDRVKKKADRYCK